MGSVKAEKAELRRALRRRVRAIPADQAKRDAKRLADRVLRLPEVQDADHVFLCLSFGIEIDTWGLAERLLKAGKKTYVPRVVLQDHSLHVHPYPCRLETLPIGLRQPAADDPTDDPTADPTAEPELAEDDIERTLDVALILGLAFDPHGVRLGHGGGFFDRFLGRHPLRTVGLAYDEQIVQTLPRQPHDVPMRRIVTPGRVVTPGQILTPD